MKLQFLIFISLILFLSCCKPKPDICIKKGKVEAETGKEYKGKIYRMRKIMVFYPDAVLAFGNLCPEKKFDITFKCRTNTEISLSFYDNVSKLATPIFVNSNKWKEFTVNYHSYLFDTLFIKTTKSNSYDLFLLDWIELN